VSAKRSIREIEVRRTIGSMRRRLAEYPREMEVAREGARFEERATRHGPSLHRTFCVGTRASLSRAHGRGGGGDPAQAGRGLAGPVLLRWLEQLLQDREERRERERESEPPKL